MGIDSRVVGTTTLLSMLMGYFLIVPTYLHVYGGRDCRVNSLKRGHGPTTAVKSGVLHLVCAGV